MGAILNEDAEDVPEVRESLLEHAAHERISKKEGAQKHDFGS